MLGSLWVPPGPGQAQGRVVLWRSHLLWAMQLDSSGEFGEMARTPLRVLSTGRRARAEPLAARESSGQAAEGISAGSRGLAWEGAGVQLVHFKGRDLLFGSLRARPEAMVSCPGMLGRSRNSRTWPFSPFLSDPQSGGSYGVGGGRCWAVLLGCPAE